MNSNKIVNDFLHNRIVDKAQFNELCSVVDFLNSNNVSFNITNKVLSFFVFLHRNEIIGWRNRETTLKISKLLIDNEQHPIQLYSLFCPSYKKGLGQSGFRTDGVGDTTKSGIFNILKFYENSVSLGFKFKKPIAIFFDLAVEQPENVLPTGIDDLRINIYNFKEVLPRRVKFFLLSQDKFLFDEIGYLGKQTDQLFVPDNVFNEVVERGYKFYKQFGWSRNQVISRSKVIVASEAIVGEWLRKKFPSGIMLYTPTMLERSKIYSGFKYKTDPLPIVFPKKLGR